VGAVIRTAAGLGVSRVVILKEAAHPFHPKSVRVAGSSIFRVPILEGPPLKELVTSGAPLITLSPKGEDVDKYQFPSSFCLVPGLEGPGIPECLERAATLAIPMKNGVESLNAAMATGIVLYLWQRGLDHELNIDDRILANP
jgi:tRNA G18 (ribose-2'-O)-methylase SpoU